MMELCLGTVQFGLDYGIQNVKKPALADAVSWLDYATQNGIRAIDTAKAYGTAEEVVGTFLERKTIPRDSLTISTKFLPNLLDEVKPEYYLSVIENELKSQLETLHTDYVDAYVFHSARYAFDEEKLSAIHRMKEKGFARRVGVSVYKPREAEACFSSSYVDFIQAPYSIFDHRMKANGILDSEKRGDCMIDTRSAFIQGLIVMDEEHVPEFLSEAKTIVGKINRICAENDISRVQLALQYVKREKSISHLVFGVDSLDQLKEDIDLFEKSLPDDLMEEIGKEFDGLKAEIVMPSLWHKE